MVVGESNFAVQRPAAILKNLYAAVDQIAIQQAGADFNDRNIRLALHDQLNPHAAAGGVTHRMQQPVAGEKVGVGNDHFPAGVSQHLEIMAFNIIAMFLIIPPDKQRLRFSGAAVDRRLVSTPEPPAARLFAGREIFQLKLQDILHHRSLHLNGIILLCLRAVVGHVLGGVIDAPDEGRRLIDHHDFAVHAAEQIGAHAEQARARIVVAKNHAGGTQLIDETLTQVGRTVAVEQYFDPYPAACGF